MNSVGGAGAAACGNGLLGRGSEVLGLPDPRAFSPNGP